jgi:hypothetical protein
MIIPQQVAYVEAHVNEITREMVIGLSVSKDLSGHILDWTQTRAGRYGTGIQQSHTFTLSWRWPPPG